MMKRILSIVAGMVTIPLSVFSQVIDSVKSDNYMVDSLYLLIEDSTYTGSVQADTAVFLFAEEMPQFPGGEAAMYAFLSKKIKYPDDAKERKISGIVYTQIIIEKDGSIRNINVYRGVPEGKMLEEEAIRVIKLMPKWKPGKQNGQAVRVYYTVRVKFLLEER